MDLYSGHIYHVYNQGNNREKIFFEKDNYMYFLEKMYDHLSSHVHLLAWCLMPNHFHWLLKVKKSSTTGESNHEEKLVQPLNRSIAILLSSYTKAVNKSYNRSGSLFRARTKAKLLSGDIKKRDYYGAICFYYIHQNPLKAGLVDQLGEWEYSSFRDYAGLRNGTLCNKKMARELFDLPKSSEKFYKSSMQKISNEITKYIL